MNTPAQQSVTTFTLIIPTLNQHRRALRAISSAKTSHPWRVLVVDNEEQPTRCVAESWNLGIHVAFNDIQSEFAIVSNDDVVYHPDCLDAMVADAKAGALFVNCRLLRNPYRMDSAFTQGGFSLFLITRECWSRVGAFDVGFKPAYYEDNDYFYRMKLAGVQETVCPLAGFYHEISGRNLGCTTTLADPQMRAAHASVMAKNREYYIQKWGGEPGSEVFTKPFNQ